jgi:hypothetical protein
MIFFRWFVLLFISGTTAFASIPGLDEAFLEVHEARMEQLFHGLDPEHPGVGPLVQSWESGERLKAIDGLARYLGKDRPERRILPPVPLPNNVLEQATSALENRFFLLDRWEQVPSSSGGIDWLYRGNRDDKEWAWMLNRHEVFPMLAHAWQVSDNPAYRDKLNALWVDWILSNPYPNRIAFSPPWRALEVARRLLLAWLPLSSEGSTMEPETRLLLFASLLDHGDALAEHASWWGGNHLITEKIALLALATTWPEFAQSAAWAQHAIEEVTTQLLAQSYPDGSYKELSNHYQRVVLVNTQRFLQLLAHLDPDYRQRPVTRHIESMWDFFARSMRPDGTGPLNNASDLENNATFVLEAARFFDREDWHFMATGGREGLPPEGTPSVLFPWAGQAFLRSDWTPKAHWVYFDAGPYGTAHQHVDRMHVSASLHGQALLVDTGRYLYRPGSFKDYFQGPAGHNVIRIDGQPARQAPRQTSAPLRTAFHADETVAYAAARSLFFPDDTRVPLSSVSPIPWTRSLLLDKRGFLIVVDHLVTFLPQAVSTQWHFHPSISSTQAQKALRRVDPVGAPAPEVLRGVETPVPAGFFSPDYNQRLPATLLRFEERLSRPSSLIWLLQKPDEPPLEIELISTPGHPLLEFTVLSGGRPVASAQLRLFPHPALIHYQSF